MSAFDLDESVDTECGETDCRAQIDCGEGFLCPRCGDYFCDQHMLVDTSTPEWTQLCLECDRESREV